MYVFAISKEHNCTNQLDVSYLAHKMNISSISVAQLMNGLKVCFYHVVFSWRCLVDVVSCNNSFCVFDKLSKKLNILQRYNKVKNFPSIMAHVQLNNLCYSLKDMLKVKTWSDDHTVSSIRNSNDQVDELNSNTPETTNNHFNALEMVLKTNTLDTHSLRNRFPVNENIKHSPKVQVSTTICSARTCSHPLHLSGFETSKDGFLYCIEDTEADTNLNNQTKCISSTERAREYLKKFGKGITAYCTDFGQASAPRILHKNIVTSRAMHSTKSSKTTGVHSLKQTKHSLCLDASSEQKYTGGACNAISLTKGKQCTAFQVCQGYENKSGDKEHQGFIQDQFIEILHGQTLFPMAEPEVLDIQNAVEFLVCRLLYKVGELDSRFFIRHIVPNGSFYDGTKISLPDEFDFLAVVDKLSDNHLTISRECNHNPGYAHLSDGKLNSDWAPLSADGYLYSIKQFGDAQSFRDQFRIAFHKSLREQISEGCKDKIHYITGILQLSGYNVSLHGPECIVNATWHSRTNLTSFPVTIDVCPAIAADYASDILSEKDVLFSSAYQSVLQNVRFYLIPSDSRSCPFCFKFVFTDSDRSLVTTLNEAHSKCFRTLKLLFKAACQENQSLQRVVNSFALKMAVLWHADQCLEAKSTKSCLLEILEYLRTKCLMTEPFLSNVHIKMRNIWKTLDPTRHTDRQCFNTVIQLIERISEMLEGDDQHVEDFLKSLSSVSELNN